MAQGRQTESIEKFEHACSMEPDDPALLRNLLTAEIKAKDVAARDEVVKRLFAHPKLDPLLRASVLSELGDDAWRNNQLDAAARQYAEAAALPVDPQNHRNAVAHAEALKTPARAEVLKPLLIDGQTDAGQLFKMRDYLDANPNDSLVEYLLGRQFVQRDAEDRGIPLLESALKNSLPDISFSRETDRLLVRAYAERHQCSEAQGVHNRMSSTQAPTADLQFASDWVARCVYETGRGWSPL
jgi:hypothetical protein